MHDCNAAVRSTLSAGAEAHVEWHGFTAPDAHFGHEGPISFFLDLNLVRAFGQLHHQPFGAFRSIPFLTVDQYGRTAGLHAYRYRSGFRVRGNVTALLRFDAIPIARRRTTAVRIS